MFSMTIEARILEGPENFDAVEPNKFETVVPRGLKIDTEYSRYRLEIEDVSTRFIGGRIGVKFPNASGTEVVVEGSINVKTINVPNETSVLADIMPGEAISMTVRTEDGIKTLARFTHIK